MSAVGTEPWRQSQHVDHESSDQAGGLDAQKKTLGASERREEERGKFREQMKQMDARRLVIVDECGSNIALTPLYGWAPKGERAYGSVPPESSEKIRPCWPPCRFPGSEPV